jgi:MFS family permease
MKEEDKFRELWSQHEQQLQQQVSINTDLLRKINMDKVEKKMKSLVRIKAIALSFYILIGFLLIGYIVAKWPQPVFVISGVILAVLAFTIVYTSVKELKLILTIDYSATISQLQKQLLNIRSVVIKYLRKLIWIFPLYMAFVVLFFDLVFGINIIQHGDRIWILMQSVISVFVMIPLVVWMLKKLVPENADKKWMRWILKGNGTQITEALELLREVAIR